jgi:7-cyano-7-deazaguanine synthase in queuosine biosynthesis
VKRDTLYRFVYTDREEIRPGWTSLSSENIAHGDSLVDDLRKPLGTPPVWAQDLLRIARVVYLVDRLAEREKQPDGQTPSCDGWTRNIALDIQLADPAPWRSDPGLLNATLNTLTSDDWDVTVSAGAPSYPEGGVMFDHWRATEVALFSGGLDSTAHAASRARNGEGKLLLVAHYSDFEKAQQKGICDAVQSINGSVHLHQFSQQPGRPLSWIARHRNPELSTRTRGLLFIAAAVYAAAAHRVDEVAIPENGQLAINPPLAANRVGACSSRSVHPKALELINQLIRTGGGAIKVVNPLVGLTKADVCRLALDSGLSPEVLARTVSCGRPPRRRGRGPYAHCGCCFPCLVRRAGLWHALHGQDGTEYQDDPWNVPPNSDRRNDLVAVLSWLAAGEFTRRDLVADLPLPASYSLGFVLSVIRQGQDELRAFLHDALPQGLPYRDWLTSSPLPLDVAVSPQDNRAEGHGGQVIV